MTQYLTFPNINAGQGRSHAQALANGCDPQGTTQYWWSILGGVNGLGGFIPPDGTSVVMIVNGTFYSQQGMTTPEKGNLKTAADLIAAGWTVPANA
jgi:hypothetical protein